MSMNREDWRQVDRTGLSAAWRIGLICLVVALIMIGTWAIGVAWAPWKGQGEAFKQKESANNRIAAQERFEQLHEEILAADRRLAPLWETKQANPRDSIAATTYSGAVTYCIGVVADYNAEARKYTARDFRAYDLPERIDDTDPATDCKPGGGF